MSRCSVFDRLSSPKVFPMAETTDQDSCWGAPVARVLHPMRVQIVESLRRAGRPLSATDLVPPLGGTCMRTRIERHLCRLERLGVIASADRTTGRMRTYRLVA